MKSPFTIKRIVKGQGGKALLNGAGLPITRRIDPMLDLVRYIGVDPAFSDDGDHWGVVVVGVDNEDHYYVLESKRGKGWNQCQEAMLYLAEKWRPRVIAIERAGAQAALTEGLKAAPRFRKIKDKIELISHNSRSKPWRIENWVLELLRAGRLYLNPLERTMKDEMKDYNPDSVDPEDALLDALAFAIMVGKKGRSVTGDIRKRLEARNRKANLQEGVDLKRLQRRRSPAYVRPLPHRVA